MRNYQILIALILLAAPIYQCGTVEKIDMITLRTDTLTEQFSQSDLQKGADQAKSWGNTSSEFYKCSNLSNKYYSTMSNTFTLSKTFTNLNSHDYVYITFDYVFLNVAKQALPVTKNGELYIDQSVQGFSGTVWTNNYGCMTLEANKADGQSSTSLLFSHSANTMTIKIKPTNLGTVARLGVANMKITTADCGVNAEFDTSTLKCKCKSGYSMKIYPGYRTPEIPYDMYLLFKCE